MPIYHPNADTPDDSPGLFIKNHLITLAVHRDTAADILKVSRKSFELMIEDTKPITYKFALRIEMYLGISAYEIARRGFERDFFRAERAFHKSVKNRAREIRMIP